MKTILDLGCGTGNHAIPLAQRGYQVTGVDRAPEMLSQARQKISALPLPAQVSHGSEFILGDLRSLDLQKRFDAVLMMFAVLGYQIADEDIEAALKTVSTHLKPSGLFIFDVWYGPAVVRQRPDKREKEMPAPDGKIIRVASGTLRPELNQCEVCYQVKKFKGDRIASECEEKHIMRYFFPEEIPVFLDRAGLNLLDMKAFGDLNQPPTGETWNVIAIARAGS